MTIDVRIKEIEWRLEEGAYYAQGNEDITFLLSELKRCRKMVSQKYTCQGCGHTASLMGANEALHPEGVK